MPVYLLHSTRAASRGGTSGARHYVGFTTERNLWQRLAMHASGRSHIGLIEKWQKLGATVYLTMLVVDGTPTLERYLKANGHYDEVCPLCRGDIHLTTCYDIANVLTFRTAHGGQRSLKPTASVLANSSDGIISSRCGLYLQLLLPTGRTMSARAAVPTPGTRGGYGSSATVQQRRLAERSAITRQVLSEGSRLTNPTHNPVSQLKLVLERHLQTVPMWAEGLLNPTCDRGDGKTSRNEADDVSV